VINTTETLLNRLESQLTYINRQHGDTLWLCREAIKASGNTIVKLKKIILSGDFTSQQEEIYFFKSLKPRFAAWLIYYKKMYEIELGKPQDDNTRYYQKHIKKLQKYNEENNALLQYLRSGSTHLDNAYFTRKEPAIDLYLNPFFFEAEPRFTTSYDYKVARLMANERLYRYLLTRLTESADNQYQKAEVNQNSDSPWSGTKAELIELLYSLHFSGVLYNGTDLSRSAQFIEETFGVSLGQYRRTFIELRNRKKEQTKFNDKLTKSFLFGIDAAEDK